jgi:hypothetical protein
MLLLVSYVNQCLLLYSGLGKAALEKYHDDSSIRLTVQITKKWTPHPDKIFRGGRPSLRRNCPRQREPCRENIETKNGKIERENFLEHIAWKLWSGEVIPT